MQAEAWPNASGGSEARFISCVGEKEDPSWRIPVEQNRATLGHLVSPLAPLLDADLDAMIAALREVPASPNLAPAAQLSVSGGRAPATRPAAQP